MRRENFEVLGRACRMYLPDEGLKDVQAVLIQPVDDHDLEGMEREVSAICESVGGKSPIPFVLVTFPVKSWNEDLSPWEALPVFGDEPFGKGAEETLRLIEEELIPTIEMRFSLTPEGELTDQELTIPLILGGYSLAGFFALWSAYQTDRFVSVVAASPSVWFPGWIDYAKAHDPKAKAIYLSLGGKEEKTRHPVMSRVGDCIREQADILSASQVESVLEWNPGNHFRDADLRCAKGFVWCLKRLREACH